MRIRVVDDTVKVAITKSDGGTQRYGYKLRLGDIDHLFDLYCKDTTVRDMAEDLGISPSTVQKYLDQGDPQRGIEALKARRQRLVQSAMALQDGKLAERMSNSTALAAEAFSMSTKRLMERYEASRRLDDSRDLLEWEKERLERIALEPDLGDMNAFHRVQYDLFKLAREMVHGPMTKGGVTVNLSQAQNQGVATLLSDSDVGLVYEHIQDLASLTSTDQQKIGRVVETLSERLEDASTPLAPRRPEDDIRS